MRVAGFITVCVMLHCKSVASRSASHPSFLPRNIVNHGVVSNALQVRGGAKSKRRGKATSLNSSRTAVGSKKVQAGKEKEKSSALGDTLQKYKQILPLTRIYITMVAAATCLGMVLGEELTQGLLALDPIRTFYGLELWRPFTAATFLGPPSIGWLMSGYFLFEYGTSLERAYGTAQYLVFLFSQIILLTVFAVLFAQPFFTNSVITAMLHVLSRSMPHQKVRWLVFTVPYWSLPYGLMMSDVLQAGSATAALPHVLGILSGHFYYFHKYVWPKTGGEDWLAAPGFLVKRLDPNARKESTNKEAVNTALKSRKKGKGRKLGGKK
jgi:membrane associated rhomboid family serine protease